MKKIILLMALSVVFGLQVNAQQPVSLTDLRKHIAALKQNERYRVTYSKEVDRSLVFSVLSAPQRGTYATPETAIPLNVGFDFQGNSFTGARDEFVIFFHSLGRRWNFLKDETLRAVVDGREVRLSRSEQDKTFKNTFLNNKWSRESLVFRVRRADLEKIAAAQQSVEIKLSDLFYKVEARDLEHVRNLLEMAKAKS